MHRFDTIPTLWRHDVDMCPCCERNPEYMDDGWPNSLGGGDLRLREAHMTSLSWDNVKCWWAQAVIRQFCIIIHGGDDRMECNIRQVIWIATRKSGIFRDCWDLTYQPSDFFRTVRQINDRYIVTHLLRGAILYNVGILRARTTFRHQTEYGCRYTWWHCKRLVQWTVSHFGKIVSMHWDRNKMDTISQTTFAFGFSWIKPLVFDSNYIEVMVIALGFTGDKTWLKCLWSLFLWTHLIIFKH